MAYTARFIISPFSYKMLILLSAASSISCACEEPMTKTFEKNGKGPIEQEKCYEALGCVSITSGWFHEKWRPVNLMPEDRHVINTHFILWKMKHGNISELQLPPSPEALSALHMDTTKNVIVIIHDFTSNAYAEWVKAVSKTNAPFTHLIGHGVGAHIAGYVGKCTPNLGRITGLDPTGPYFVGMPPFTRLHYRDASLVEVVHTDGSKGGQGYNMALGHIDYFPNSGKRQPGCKKDKKYGHIRSIKRCDLSLGQIIPGCSHKRAYTYYIEAISNKSCVFVGYKCKSYKSFLLGKCIRCGEDTENCATMGLQSPQNKYTVYRPLSKFYLLTSDETNFCMEVLKFTLSLAYSEEAHKTIKGIFNVTIYQNNRTISLLLNEKAANRNLVHGRSYTFLVYHKTPPIILMPIHRVAMGWRHDLDPFCRNYNFGAYIHNFTITKLIGNDHGPHTGFCANTTEGFKLIKDGLSVEFLRCVVI